MAEASSTRRRFLNILLGTGAIAWFATVLYPVLRYFRVPERAGPSVQNVKVGNVADFPPDSGHIFKFGRKPGILVHTPNGKFRAFSAECTHLDCTVQYSKKRQQIWCACHNGLYDLNGINVGGPPPRPLTPFKVDIDDAGDIHVSRQA